MPEENKAPDLTGLATDVQEYIKGLVTKAEELTTTVTEATKTIDEQKAEIEKASKPADPPKPDDDPLAKADPAIKALIQKAQDEAAAATKKADEAEKMAKAEKDARLNVEFVTMAKADLKDLSVKFDEFGPVLKSISEKVTPEEFKSVIDVLKTASKQLESAGIFNELGAGGSGTDVSDLDKAIKAEILKSEGKLDYAAAAVKVTDEHPELYIAHRTAAQKGN